MNPPVTQWLGEEHSLLIVTVCERLKHEMPVRTVSPQPFSSVFHDGKEPLIGALSLKKGSGYGGEL